MQIRYFFDSDVVKRLGVFQGTMPWSILAISCGPLQISMILEEAKRNPHLVNFNVCVWRKEWASGSDCFNGGGAKMSKNHENLVILYYGKKADFDEGEWEPRGLTADFFPQGLEPKLKEQKASDKIRLTCFEAFPERKKSEIDGDVQNPSEKSFYFADHLVSNIVFSLYCKKITKNNHYFFSLNVYSDTYDLFP